MATAPISGQIVPGMTKVNWFVVGFNAAVVVYSIVAWLWAGVCFLKLHVKIEQSEFFAYAIRYTGYFFSVWGTILFSMHSYLILAINIMEIKLKTKEEKSENTVKKIKKLRTISSYLFFSAVFPIVATACLEFWALYYVDRELIYPRLTDEIFPAWVNHSMHTMPLPLLVYYGILENVPPMKHTLPGTIGITALFSASVSYIKQRDDKFIYYGLNFFTEDQRLRFFLLFPIMMTYCSILGTTIGKTGRGFRQSLKENWHEWFKGPESADCGLRKEDIFVKKF